MSFIPYRDSKLTRILKNSLGGNSQTVMLLTLSPSFSNLQETFSTLRFGSKAMLVTNKVKINLSFSIKELQNKILDF